jgi:hypothetical protein
MDLKLTKMKDKVTLNKEQKLYVIPSNGGIVVMVFKFYTTKSID